MYSSDVTVPGPVSVTDLNCQISTEITVPGGSISTEVTEPNDFIPLKSPSPTKPSRLVSPPGRVSPNSGDCFLTEVTAHHGPHPHLSPQVGHRTP